MGKENTLASYVISSVPAYKGNPLIEALPRIRTTQEFINDISVNPAWDDSILGADFQSKILALDSISHSFQPIPMTLEIKESIDRLIRLGYSNRNPCLSYHEKEFDFISGMSILGVSGIGKSTNINRVLSTYNQVITHNYYNEVPLFITQVVWLKINCPFDGSIKGLLYEFYLQLDHLLGTTYYERFVKTRATVDIMVQSSYTVAQTCSLGLIIIDEIQHLINAPRNQKSTILNFFVTLTNTIGVPVVYIGTPAAFEVLRSEFRQARRATGIVRSIIWDKHNNDEVWAQLVSSLWKYQVTSDHTPLTKELIDALYFESQGIVDLLKKVYIASQVLALRSKSKQLDPKIIREAAKSQFQLIESQIVALKSKNTKAIFGHKDIYIPQTTVLTNKELQESIRIEPHIPHRKPQQSSSTTTTENTKLIKPQKSSDVRNVITEGKKRNQTAYLSLLEAKYILIETNDLIWSD